MKKLLVEAACKTKGLDPATIEAIDREGDDLFLYLTGGGVVRVEVSALPSELLEEEPDQPTPETDLTTRPLPEHTTLAEPKPTALKAQAKRKR